MKKVTGIGGIFFKTPDPEKTKEWYAKHLGIIPDSDGYISFYWREKDDPETVGFTAWSPFRDDTKYFEPSQSPFMMNFRVDNLDALLEQLKAEGVQVVGEVEECDYGRFGWIIDPDGIKIELWEPPKGGKE
ncbi:MAG: VOC family protein [Blastocatellia bacterium]|nr:VOC family protein [Blastocatellia bacterium]